MSRLEDMGRGHHFLVGTGLAEREGLLKAASWKKAGQASGRGGRNCTIGKRRVSLPNISAGEEGMLVT